MQSMTKTASDATPEFHETWPQRLRRWGLGVLYALRPSRIALLPRLWLMTLAYLLTPAGERDRLPHHPKFYGERGLVGISNDLSVPALLANYRRGFYPVCHIGPMKWWCPEERAIIDPAETHISKKVRKLLRQHKFAVTMDQDFAGVMEACARPRPGKVPLTWITPRIMEAFWNAYKAGYAHSVEVWDDKGNLVGGLFGIAIGKVYFGESQFSAIEHASKIATVALHKHLAAWGYRLREGQLMTPHLASLGFKPMTRDEFRSLLGWYIDEPGRVGHWAIDPTIDLAGDPATPDQPPVPRAPAPAQVA
ncbi:MAG: leucyl/phenylalanyl-tRNA--protein transferase [Hyphomicrobiales bacterium]